MAQHSATASPSHSAGPAAPNSNTNNSDNITHPSSSTTANSHPNDPAAQHKRVYQACIPCRRRKVRCDLGSVDNPHDPPCVRCRRESKECFFSATRRKRKNDSDPDPGASDGDDYILRNGRKRLHANSTPPRDLDRRYYSQLPLTPGGSQGRTQPLRRPDDRPDRPPGSARRRDDHGDSDHSNANEQLENVEAQRVMGGAVYGPHDALDLLYKAATDGSVAMAQAKAALNSGNSAETRVANEGSLSSPPMPNMASTATNATKAATSGPTTATMTAAEMRRAESSHNHPYPHQRRESRASTAPQGPLGSLDRDGRESLRTEKRPGLSSGGSFDRPRDRGAWGGSTAGTQQAIDPELEQPHPSEQPRYLDALRAWTRFRFVRAGWFTPQEAVDYIDYYYKYLSPMTPISPPTFSDPATHLTLLTDEPILAVTLLTIASRYKQLDGPGGHCRSYAIHEQLWTYLRGMIERCLWGQEAFGSGFCGSGSASIIEEATAQTSSTAPWRGMRKGSLRTLGTIESLMILTEWHPRALHFPPQDATDELMLPDFSVPPAVRPEPDPAADEGSRNLGAGFGGKRIESWLEPAWRSDRMCWMLLSTAMGLAYELGVFDDIDEMLKDDAMTRPEFQDEVYRARANRIKRLLLIYTTQLAGRLGWTTMAPEAVRRNDPAFSRRKHLAADEPTPGTTLSSLSNTFNYIPDMELDDQIIHCWAGISNLMHLGNEKLFPSRKHTTDIIQSGRYVDLLAAFSPWLRDWLREFEMFRLPPFIRCILRIEYEYVRIYVNSLSLQAVVERCTTTAVANNNSHNSGSGSGGAATGTGNDNGTGSRGGDSSSNNGTGTAAPQLSPQTIMNYGKLPLGQLGGFTIHDQEYVREVVEGSRDLLKTVVEGLLPGGYLKHAPVRTYFRIISGAMFLLKTFALGAPRADVKVSIQLMDATVEALRNCVVDDVHLGIRFSDLLESLTSRLRNRFIQAPTMQQASGRGQSPVGDDDAAGGGGGGGGHGDWSGHAQSLRDGLHGEKFASPVDMSGISATPFDLSNATFPYPGGASLGPSTPAAALEMGHHASSLNHHAHASSVPNNANANSNTSNSNNHAPAPGSGMDATLFDEWNNPGNEMWYLPTGPAFFQNAAAAGSGGGDSGVAMTSEGINVNGLDLLEYMAMDPGQFPGGFT